MCWNFRWGGREGVIERVTLQREEGDQAVLLKSMLSRSSKCRAPSRAQACCVRLGGLWRTETVGRGREEL